MNELGRFVVRNGFLVGRSFSFSCARMDGYQSNWKDGKLYITLAKMGDPDENLIVASPDDIIPEAVLQYERQLRKTKAADRAGSLVSKDQHMHVLYEDPHVVVTNKPSGILCVPGIHHHPSLLTLVHEEYAPSLPRDKMIVHRLDMDTSGVVVFGRTPEIVASLQGAFRERRVDKSYEALVCGHVLTDEGVIDLPLQRDHERPPFMRVSTASSEQAAAQAVHDLRHHGWKKLVRKRPKLSQTEWTVQSREYLEQLPVTRLSLSPITGRYVGQLVKCALWQFAFHFAHHFAFGCHHLGHINCECIVRPWGMPLLGILPMAFTGKRRPMVDLTIR
jgi:23S rRNA-/tRNA-specific pseudouridylate synthase